MHSEPNTVSYCEVVDDFGEVSCPFDDYLEDLQDLQGRGLIEAAIDKFERGLLGDTRSVGGGVWEHRIDSGPGYRIYYAFEGSNSLIVLLAGRKNRQEKDITRAQKLWEQYQKCL